MHVILILLRGTHFSQTSRSPLARPGGAVPRGGGFPQRQQGRHGRHRRRLQGPGLQPDPARHQLRHAGRHRELRSGAGGVLLSDWMEVVVVRVLSGFVREIDGSWCSYGLKAVVTWWDNFPHDD